MNRRAGVIAVIRNEDRFLVIERSQNVTAPGAYCFPGGGVERGEDEPTALKREVFEELAIVGAEPIRCLWRSESPRGTSLAWWLTEIMPGAQIVANPSEVASFHWWTAERMLSHDRLLPTNRDFLQAIERGDFTVSVER